MSTLARKPAPDQRAPERPAPSSQYNPSIKSSTLSRLDLLKHRQQRAQEAKRTQEAAHFGRLTANGHSNHLQTRAETPLQLSGQSYGHYRDAGEPELIYSPASISSAREFGATRQRQSTGGGGGWASSVEGLKRQWQTPPSNGGLPNGCHTLSSGVQPAAQHYAATSVRSVPPHRPIGAQFRPNLNGTTIESTPVANHERSCTHSTTMGQSRRSGRESALGSLFGTIRRKAASRWSSSQSQSSSGVSSAPTEQGAPQLQRQRSSSSLSGRNFFKFSKNNNNIDENNFSQQVARRRERVYGRGLFSSSSSSAYNAPSTQDKKRLEADEIYAEGAHAIDSNSVPRTEQDEDPLADQEQWSSGESRQLLEESSRQQADFIELNRILINWINDELAEQRIIIGDLREDLYDGQVLCRLIERLQGVRLDVVEVTQNEQLQRKKLHTILETLNRIVSQRAGRWAKIRWSLDGIHQKNSIEIIHLLVTLAKLYRAPLRLPPNVVVDVSTYFKNRHGQLTRRSHKEQLTGPDERHLERSLGWSEGSQMGRQASGQANSASGGRQPLGPGDAFDVLFNHEPNKLMVVSQILLRFCNRHLNKINITAGQVLDADKFTDGLLLVFLISSLEGYFVPLGNLFTSVTKYQQYQKRARNYQETSLDTLPYMDSNNNISTYIQPNQNPIEFRTAIESNSYTHTQPIEKLHNVNLALQLIEEAGLVDIRQTIRAEDIVNGDARAVSRLLYALFSRYKHL